MRDVADVMLLAAKAEIRVDKFQTYMLRRLGQGWECVAFQNTEMSRRAKRAYAN